MPVDNYLELIQLDSDYDIYISRKALKHFVESRKREMVEKYDKKEIINKLYFCVENVILTYIKYDNCKLQESNNRLIYTKYFADVKKSSLRIVFETVNNRLEICSIHSQKRKIPP